MVIRSLAAIVTAIFFISPISATDPTEVVVKRETTQYVALMKACSESKKFDLRPLLTDEKIVSVDFSQLLPSDLERLGLKAKEKYPRLKPGKKGKGRAGYSVTYPFALTGIFDCMLPQGKVQSITIRIGEQKTFWQYENAIKDLRQNGVKVMVISEQNSGLLNDFFQHRFIPDGIYKRLLVFLALRDGFENNSSGLYYSYLGCYLTSVMNLTDKGGNWLFIEATLAAYDEIKSNKLVWRMNTTGCAFAPIKAHPMVLTLFRLGTFPDLMQTYMLVMKLRLNFGIDLFGEKGGRIYQKNWDLLTKITHKDTPHLLRYLRAFIPDFVDEDYQPEAKNRDFLYLSRLSDVYGHRPAQGSSRNEVFIDFVEALGGYENETQLPRLRRLLSILTVSHLEKFETSCGDFRTYGGFIQPITRALRYVSSLTSELGPDSLSDFAVFVKTNYPKFNPLSMEAEREFKKIVTAWEEL